MNALARSLLPALLLGVSTPAFAGHHRHDDHRHSVAPVPDGTVQVVNRAGTTLTVFVEGNAPRVVYPDQVAYFGVRPGDVTVRATYRQFGQEFTLDTDHLMVAPARFVATTLWPETTARVLVANMTPLPADLRADGRVVATFAPHQERVVSLPAKSTSLSLVADGRTLDTRQVRLRVYEEQRVRFETPTFGLVEIDNDHWLPVKVQVDGVIKATLGPEVDTRLSLSLGWHHVVTRDVEGRVIADSWVEVEPYDLARVRVGHDRRPPVADARNGHGRDGEDDGRYDDHQAANHGSSRR